MRGKARARQENYDGSEAMKSFKVTDFNAPLMEVDQPTPQPSGTQVLIKVKAAGVCHSDLHIWEGGYDLGHGRKPLSLRDRGVSLPRTMGHETVGEVLAFGPDAMGDTGGLKVGDVALVYPWLGCGKCETCLAGDENMCLKPNSLGVYCDGGYADHMTVPHPRYLLNLKGLDPVTAAPYACSGVTTYSALKKVESSFNTPIVIFGAGGLGLMALSLLKAMGGKGAIVVDIDARKREARHRRPVRRRRAVGAAADPDQGHHHPGQLCRQLARNAGTARSRSRQEDRTDSGDADAAGQGQRGADRSAKGQADRPGGADAVTSLRAQRSNPFFLCGDMDCFASLAMTVSSLRLS